ncbi:MAG: thioredoxin [Erysipelotrichaceae bacterium]|nr:thioredoxin [Erysipelotrichaceae bacterium]MDD3924013.1 thioredoxin [Erysipelotrichaceae bacterium]MDD4642726.1 thioredoxin [Erysipelotrichaceae bacterium]
MNLTKVTKENFKEEVINSQRPVLIDFYADWCGPCKMLSPVIEQISNERDDVKVVKIDVDKEIELARQFGIMSIPTVMVIKDGKVKNTSLGYKSKEAILSLL